MDVVNSFTECAALVRAQAWQASIVTIGNFDGIHLAHQDILGTTAAWAATHKLPAIVITFPEHPRAFITRTPLDRISTVEQRLEAFARLGIDLTAMVPFDARLQGMTAREFCAEIVVKTMRVRGLVLGYNNCIGRDREGTPEYLQKLGAEMGFEVRIAPCRMLGETPVSSSAVRRCIEAGELDQAAGLLGRSYAIRGGVQHGRKSGRSIGFPTMNLSLAGLVHPPFGVYAVRVRVRGTVYAGAANIGVRPTFGEGQTTPMLEVHALDFARECYGEDVEVEFLYKLRDERRFAGIQELKAQIAQDVASIRAQVGAPVTKGS